MSHLNDEQIVLAMDNELDAESARHLRTCSVCSARRLRLERAMATYAASRRPSRAWWLTVPAAAAAIFLVWPSRAAYLPDSALTPGVARAASAAEVCALPDGEFQATQEQARRVFAAYRINRPKPRQYEVDYLITPALGGAADIANLWPQPYEEGVWTARVKDALEDYLRGQVCTGRMELTTAQKEIAANWVEAYQRHFRTARPLTEHALFMKDRPWE
ncbi:MAG: hypothetical protein FJW30_11310 [Acidobacteria bacterium]|nr:hypothetical protein [Acidobacteriota bacterium]